MVESLPEKETQRFQAHLQVRLIYIKCLLIVCESACRALCKAINENRLKGCFQEFVSLYTSALDIRRKLSVRSREANEPHTHIHTHTSYSLYQCHPIL